jgi:hypothetical protein
MAKDYHPIDVRYKGPSTAYRGSAKRTSESPLNSLRKAQPITPPQRQHQPAQPPTQSPWGTKYRAQTSQPAPPRLQKPPTTAVTAKTALRGVGGIFDVFFGVVKTLKYIYFGFIALVFLIAFVL